jgi:hypothetical protein
VVMKMLMILHLVVSCMRTQRCKLIFLCIAFALWLCPSSLLLPSGARPPSSAALLGSWQAYPRVELITRTYADRYFALLHVLIPSTLLFWPWAAAPLTLVLDAESAKDREMGVLLAHMYPSLVRVEFSALPSLPGIFEGAWTTKGGVGYDRQQRDTLLLDLHSSAEVLCMIDTDAAFITAVSPPELFAARSGSSGAAGGKQWRLRIKGSALSPAFENATERALGAPFVADFMVAFPVCVYREHLPLFRAHLVRTAAANFASGSRGGSGSAAGLQLQPPASFDEAVRGLGSFYSQFTLLGNYLFHFHRDDYEFHLQGYQRLPGHPAVDYDLSLPTHDLAKHLADEADPRELMLEGLCHSTQYLASPAVCAAYEGRVHEHAHSFQLEGPRELTEPWETSALPLQAHHAKHYQRLWKAQPPRAPANYRDPSID